jgi:hypothetical protein
MKQHYLIPMVIILVMGGCKSETVAPPSGNYNITGTVRDRGGIPMANAFLNFSYRLKNKQTGQIIGGDFNGTNPDSTTIAVSIGVPSTSHAHVTLENYLHVYIKTLADDTIEAGVNEITFKAKDSLGRALYSDMYFVRTALTPVDTPVTVTDVKKVFLNILQHLSANPSPFAQTDGNGIFSIPLSRLPLQESMIFQTSPNGPVDTLIFDNIQTLYAFTSTKFGSTDILASNLNGYTIALTSQK